MNWHDPVARARLAEQLGADGYNAAFAEWCATRVVSATINGYDIVPVPTRFGRLYFVLGTKEAFVTLSEAATFAAQQPPKETPMTAPSVSDVLRITIRHDGPTVTTDPNGFAAMGLIPSVMATLLKPVADLHSDLSGKARCVVYGDMDGSLILTVDELMRLAGLRLTAEEYFAVRGKIGIQHQWAEDFYDPKTGKALQPRPTLGAAP